MSSAFRWIIVTVAVATAVALALRSGTRQEVVSDNTQEICARRLARLGQALRAYAQDYGGRFPVAETPSHADRHLLPLLEGHGVRKDDFRCPARPWLPYVYHCYERRGSGNWPSWMPEKHVVTVESTPDTWLIADPVLRNRPGPHSNTQKAFNYLSVDGRVRFYTGRPREIYE